MIHILKGLKRCIKSLMQSKEERRHILVGPASLWEMKRDFQIQFLKSMDMLPEHYLLDIGCGTLRGGVPLITYLYDGHYFGVEARKEALDEGKKELREVDLEGKNPTLLLSPDISKLMVNQKFDYIWAFSVLFHMSDEILNDALNVVSEHLSEKGVFYANVNIGEKKDGNWQGFPVVTRTFAFYSQRCAKYGLSVSDIGSLLDHGHDSGDESQDSQRMLKIEKA